MKKRHPEKEKHHDHTSTSAGVLIETQEISMPHVRESSPSNGLCAGAEFTMLAYLSFCFLNNVPIQVKKLKKRRHLNYFIQCVPVHLDTGTVGFGWDNKLLLFHSTKKSRKFKKKLFIDDNRVRGGYRKRVANLETSGFEPARLWYQFNRRQNPYLDTLKGHITAAMQKLSVSSEEELYEKLLSLVVGKLK